MDEAHDPEQRYEAVFTVTIDGFGRKRHLDKAGSEIARSVYQTFGDRATVEGNGQRYRYDPERHGGSVEMTAVPPGGHGCGT